MMEDAPLEMAPLEDAPLEMASLEPVLLEPVLLEPVLLDALRRAQPPTRFSLPPFGAEVLCQVQKQTAADPFQWPYGELQGPEDL